MKPSQVARLYSQFGHQVYARCCYLLREDVAAMDVTQDVFATLLERLLSFPDDQRAGAWLRRVATNKCLNELRRRRYWQSQQMEDAPLQTSTSPFPFIENQILVRQLLARLPADKASIVVSYFMEGRTLDETAAENRCSVPTVRRTLKAFIEQAQRQFQGGES
jgi:RNA polymerase sigma-70 factor (ECF subfamily)